MTPNKIAFFALASLVLSLALLGEVGLASWLPNPSPGDVPAEAEPPGLGIRYLGIFDAALAYTLFLFALEFAAPAWLVGRAQGLATLVLGVVGLVACLALIPAAIAVLMLMITLLTALPFGPIAYLAAFGDFPTGAAAGILAAITALKILGAAFLVAANPAIVRNKALFAQVALSILLTLLVAFLIAFVPSFLASIADAIGAIIVGIVGAVWIVVTVVFALPAILRAFRSLVPV